MKVLLDENIDVRFKNLFPAEHVVFTIKDMGWNGLKNGQLLKLIAQEGFEYWIVVDKNIPYQQNLSNVNFKIVVLDVYRNTLLQIEKFLPQILLLLQSGAGESCIVLK